MSEREPAPGAAKARDHFVGDEQYPVAIANLPEARKICRWRHDDAARAHDGLRNDRRHRVRTFPQHCLLEGIGGADAGIVVSRPAVRIGRRHLQEVRHQRSKRFVISGHARGAHRRHGKAVISVNSGEDLYLVGLAPKLPVVARDLEGGFVGFGACRGEVDARRAGIGQFDQFLGQLDRGDVGRSHIGGGERQFRHLRRCGLGQFLAAVPRVHIPKTREAVDVRLAVGIDQHLAATFHDQYRMLVISDVMQRMDQVAPVRIDECRG